MSKDHFYFSRNDRIVALVLLFIIIASKARIISLPRKEHTTELITDTTEITRPQTVLQEKPVVRSYYMKDSIVVRKNSKTSSSSGRQAQPYNGNRTDNVTNPRRYTSKQPPSEPVDLNAADSLVLISLPGIGPYYSSRILRYRERLGGFVSTSQLLEINGLPDTLMKWFIIGDSIPIRKMKLNGLTLNEMRHHPYMDFYQAKAIVEMRRERGKINSPEQLSLLEEFTDQDINRLKPYLDFR